ncbi:helix-turn-helix domain-containing protein [Dactylosporangium sp. NPDC005572]|uniref:TetR/AcrR family transcriptional regulator n=1 Tax=Dactylosporangium sp. NPDC005572 TaxID=3156889 RepID=UPI0033BF20D7
MAAGRRFQEWGYHGVSMADVAADVGVTAPAVYRHFRNKQDLLAGAIESALSLVEETLVNTEHDSLEALVAAVADVVLDRRDMWTLLQREARFLDPGRHSAVQQQFRRVVAEFVQRLHVRRPELSTDDAQLLITAATAALASPSVPRSIPRALASRELARAAMAILELPWPPTTSIASRSAAPPPPTTEGLESRRAALLASAVDLFFSRGYAAVSLDDIGASIGIAGPSIYHHFPTKADILVTAFTQATDRLSEEHDQRHDDGTTPRPLVELVGIYTDFCLRNRSLVGVYVTEANNLPPDAQRRITSVLRDRTTEWTTALRDEHSAVDERIARLRALTALTVIDDLVRLGRFYKRPAIADEIRAVAMAILVDATDN